MIVAVVLVRIEGCSDREVVDRFAFDVRCKTQPPAPRKGGLFIKDQFDINLAADTVTCPNQVTAPIRRGRDGAGTAAFGAACAVPAARPVHHRGPAPSPSPSAPTRPSWTAPGTARPTRPGKPTTPRTTPRSNARSAT
ncbi:MAG: hypothetical protein ACRDRH_16180 [Pseudonocardia sp.]